MRMRDFRQKETNKLPQNKLSRDEPCLARCNTSSMVVSADPRNMAALTQFISSAMRTFWPWLCCTCFLLLFFLLKPWQLTKQPWAADPAIDDILHRGRLDSSRLGLFWGNFFFSFWRKSLILKALKFSGGKLWPYSPCFLSNDLTALSFLVVTFVHGGIEKKRHHD